jgi:Uma2 family endonuclease
VDYTSYSLDKLPIYAALGVPEIWRYTPRDRLVILHRTDDDYQEAPVSLAFPALTAETLNRLFAEGRTLDRPSWVRRVRQFARQNGTASSP